MVLYAACGDRLPENEVGVTGSRLKEETYVAPESSHS